MSRRHLSRGLTLIELMVGIAIGLIVVLAIVSLMVTQEGIRRNATSGSDSTASAAVGMLLLDRSLRNAGYGLGSGVVGGLMDTCTSQGITGLNAMREPATLEFAPMEFAPVVINPTGIPAGDNATPVIRVTYGGSTIFGAPVIPATSVTPSVRVGSRAGLNSGDLAVLGQPSMGCGIRQITALPNNLRCGSAPNLGQSDVIEFSPGQLMSDYNNCVETEADFNLQNELPFPFTPSSSLAAGLRIFPLGRPEKFQSTIYAVRNGQLTACNFIMSGCEETARAGDPAVWEPLVDGVVSLQAQYGIDANGDGIVESWVTATPATLPAWYGMLAVRFAVVTRASAFNKEEVTPTVPQWAGGAISLSHLADWKHYRYTVSQSSVALKNAIWKD